MNSQLYFTGLTMSDLMTSSLPNMEMTELDKLSDRLGKFKSPSRLPKPEISPKPAHLVAQLAKHKMVEPKVETATKKSEEKPVKEGTGAMLKSTLKRMTKLTTSPVTRTNSFKVSFTALLCKLLRPTPVNLAFFWSILSILQI